jgi:hypothetical protein
MYQWGCPQEGCRGILMWMIGYGTHVCLNCGKECRKDEGVLYDITGEEPRRLTDEEVAEIRRNHNI